MLSKRLAERFGELLLVERMRERLDERFCRRLG